MAEQLSRDVDPEELHALVDHIPASDLQAARKILRALADPVWQSILDAPVGDETETEAERADMEAACSEKGPGTPHAEVLHQFRM